MTQRAQVLNSKFNFDFLRHAEIITAKTFVWGRAPSPVQAERKLGQCSAGVTALNSRRTPGLGGEKLLSPRLDLGLSLPPMEPAHVRQLALDLPTLRNQFRRD